MALTNNDMQDLIISGFEHLISPRAADVGILDHHLPMLFFGPSGVGKTAGVHQAAKRLTEKLKRPVRAIIVKPGQADSAGDILGMPEKVAYYPCPFCLQNSEPTDEYVQAALLRHANSDHAVKTWEEVQAALVQFGDRIAIKQRFAITDVWPTAGYAILCIDEINRASPDVRNALFGLVNERVFELSGYQLPDTVFICATANPPSGDYADVQEMDGAMVKRFAVYDVLPSPEEWFEYEARQSYLQSEASKKSLAFFKAQPAVVTIKDIDNPVTANVGTGESCLRTASMLNKAANFLQGTLLAETAAGLIGATLADAYMAHMNKKDDWLHAKDIFADYGKHRDINVKAVKEGRQDAFQQTQDDIVRYLSKRSPEKPLTAKEIANFVDYLKDLMSDNVYSLLNALFAADKGAKPTDGIKAHNLALTKDKQIQAIVMEAKARIQAAKQATLTKTP